MITIELKRLRSGGTVWAMVEYSHRFPLVEISTVEGSRTRLVDGIQNDTIDIAVVTGEAASDCNRSMVLRSKRIIVALPENHALGVNDTIYGTDLKRERFLLSERDPGPAAFRTNPMGSWGFFRSLARRA